MLCVSTDTSAENSYVACIPSQSLRTSHIPAFAKVNLFKVRQGLDGQDERRKRAWGRRLASTRTMPLRTAPRLTFFSASAAVCPATTCLAMHTISPQPTEEDTSHSTAHHNYRGEERVKTGQSVRRPGHAALTTGSLGTRSK